MKPQVKNWTLADLAMAIGLRALGQEYDFIADRLNCTVSEARGVVLAARNHLKSGIWVEDLIADTDHRVIDESDRIDRSAGGPRKFRVNRASLRAPQPSPNATADLMGDPSPGKGAQPRFKGALSDG